MSDPVDMQPAPAAVAPRGLAEPAFILSCVALLGFLALIMMLIFHGVPAESKDMVNIAIGAWGGGIAGSAAAYWFGSNRASATKDATIASIAKGP